jgi:hypothetical protein
MEPIKKIEKNGLTLTIQYDEYPESPFEDWDFPETFGIDMSNHKDYKKPFCAECPVSVSDFIEYQRNPKTVYSEEEKTAFKQFKEEYLWEYVYLYDHGGRTVNTTGFSCRWDSGTAGLVYITRKVAAAEQLPVDYLVDQVQLLDWVLQGTCYSFRITNNDGVVLGSCSGYWGDMQYAEQEALEALDALSREKEEKAQQPQVVTLSDDLRAVVRDLVQYCADSREWEDWEENGCPNNHILHSAALVAFRMLGDATYSNEIDECLKKLGQREDKTHL